MLLSSCPFLCACVDLLNVVQSRIVMLQIFSLFQECHLIVHKQTHSGEKSFTCSCCSKTFQQKQLFTVHSKKHCDSSVKSTAYECLNVARAPHFGEDTLL